MMVHDITISVFGRDDPFEGRVGFTPIRVLDVVARPIHRPVGERSRRALGDRRTNGRKLLRLQLFESVASLLCRQPIPFHHEPMNV